MARDLYEVVGDTQERAVLVGIDRARSDGWTLDDDLAELSRLADTAGAVVTGVVTQRMDRPNPRTFIGSGKAEEVEQLARETGATMVVFDDDLTPSQQANLEGLLPQVRVIDRTQLILDIFAHRAMSREGKLQVEMAQLKYMLPRLSTRDDALSRLTGGIGARGPGETRLEIDRRRISDRLARLGGELKAIARERYRRRSKRRKKDLPVISLVGYTNAGKSTLLNTLTHSDIVAEDKLFATLDPTSRRLRFPTEMEVIITDTVGFIRNLPDTLLQAFKATLEELQEADLLVHVIDLSNPAYREQMAVVDRLLSELELGDIPCLKVFNKIDKAPYPVQARAEAEKEGVVISAIDPATLPPFLERAERMMGKVMEPM